MPVPDKNKGVRGMNDFLRLLDTEAAGTNNINEQWGLIGSTVVTGLVVVFMILAILVLFLWLFGKIFKLINESGDRRARRKIEMNNNMKSFKLEASSQKPSPPAVPEPAQPEATEYEEEDDEEIIAVIAAAIAAFGEAEGKQYRIASIKRPKNARSGWSSAGIADNMRGFLS